MPADRLNLKAPDSWKHWVSDGTAAIESARRVVYSRMILSKEDQQPVNTDEKRLLRQIYEHYSENPHGFEGIASFVASKTMNNNHHRGWITQRSGDGGVDFVNRVEIGSGLSSTNAIVLGQAKNYAPMTGTVSGRDLARLVARLRRGWLGAFVTTGTYTKNAQREMIVDEYPLVLNHGRDVASVIQQELLATGTTLKELFDREAYWYDTHQRNIPPEQILNGAELGTHIWPNNTP